MSQHILIVDDEVAIRQMLGFALAGNGYRCVEASNIDEAQTCIGDVRPDLILLDWMLPGISGVDFARRLKRNPKMEGIPIIMLTAKGEEVDKIKGLDSGADDYITKPFSTRELLARVRAILRRSKVDEDADLLVAGPIQLDLRTHRAMVQEKIVDFSPTEFRLLQFFITHTERVYKRSQLLDEVWGNEAYIEERTVDVHIRRLRKLLEPYGCDWMIQTVRSVGYRFSEQKD
ncbi:MAG: phosphate regulon transcriptional regulatory protein PhoB [Gammaproteobacteria bacterium]|nr:phosphate regulon transcriptional regulatory protein PhoB [Gammaproteobacteria bacterium]